LITARMRLRFSKLCIRPVKCRLGLGALVTGEGLELQLGLSVT
jgi:hypothetical protein